MVMAGFKKRKAPTGRAEVVHNGYHTDHAVQTGVCLLSVKVSKVRSRSEKPETCR